MAWFVWVCVRLRLLSKNYAVRGPHYLTYPEVDYPVVQAGIKKNTFVLDFFVRRSLSFGPVGILDSKWKTSLKPRDQVNLDTVSECR